MQNELCTPAKKDAHLSWEGHSLPSSEPQLWLKNISWGHGFLGTRAASADMTGDLLKKGIISTMVKAHVGRSRLKLL